MNLPIDNPLFLMPVLIGLIFIVAGFVLSKFPPKDVNALYGYRTNNSMKSKERWDFAQKYSSDQIIRIGGFLFLTGIVVGIIYKPEVKIAMFLGLGLVITMVIVLFIRVEKAIKIKFGKEL